MPSLAKTLCRCHSTVRALMKSCAPISGFERPSRASRAICFSCGVSSSRVSALRLRTFSPVATSSMRARSANASMPFSLNIRCAMSQLLARVRRAGSLAAAIRRRGGARARAPRGCGTAEALDRLAVQSLCGRPVADQRARARLDAQRPVGPRRRGDLRELLHRAERALAVAASARPPRSARARPRSPVPARTGAPTSRSAATRASSYRASPLKSSAVVHSAAISHRPSPRRATSCLLASISASVSSSRPP